MSESDGSNLRELNAVREMLSSDGHFVENAASMIAATSAVGTSEFTERGEALTELMDAISGTNNRISSSTVNRLVTLREVLGNRNGEIVTNAMTAALLAPDEERAKLIRALQANDLAILRSVALDLPIPGEQTPTTLREKIKNSSQP